jgi:hypothetical protein
MFETTPVSGITISGSIDGCIVATGESYFPFVVTEFSARSDSAIDLFDRAAPSE